MARIDNLNTGALKSSKRATRRLEAGSPIGYSSVSKGSLEINSAEGLRVNGSSFTRGRMEGSGTFDWSGPMWLRGAISGAGAFTFSGPCTFNGPTSLNGPTTVTGVTLLDGKTSVNGDLVVAKTLDVTGTTRLRATATLEANLAVTSGGKIMAGNLTIDPAVGAGSVSFTNGARVYTTSSSIQMYRGLGVVEVGSASAGISWGTASVVASSDGVHVAGGLTVDGGKQFLIDHPVRSGWKLGHGSTESPVSGVEYWGTGIIGSSGYETVSLPDYFEALAKPTGRTVLVTARGDIVDWTDIVDGEFCVSGTEGCRFSWLVKAERFGADFETEFATSP